MIAAVRGEVMVRRPDHAADALAVAICHGGGSGHQAAVDSASRVATGARLAG